ncbi:hypothetical protein DEAC_c22670 [Desulfosporosinus acididurans]|uniref:Uncharacterized protein n=1 Tax=Desulfosporosinus acididurans TaxID=476652 RepID=A0A0J1FQS2_9FIRM|nr:hypothetical protein [Desulfosporosinus acididurans]KLU65637.1 hypothetical protein DEAC_c22670 [Desulfosporosinus acididurans]
MDDYFNNFADTTPNLSYFTQQRGFYKACQLIRNAVSTGCQYPAGFPKTMTGVLILRKILEETGLSPIPLRLKTKFLGLKEIAISYILLK